MTQRKPKRSQRTALPHAQMIDRTVVNCQELRKWFGNPDLRIHSRSRKMFVNITAAQLRSFVTAFKSKTPGGVGLVGASLQDLLDAMDKWLADGSAEAAQSIMQHAEQILGWSYHGNSQLALAGAAISGAGQLNGKQSSMATQAAASGESTAQNSMEITLDYELNRVTRNGKSGQLSKSHWAMFVIAYRGGSKGYSRDEFVEQYSCGRKCRVSSSTIASYATRLNQTLQPLGLAFDTGRHVITEIP